ncbi:MAG: hypothetical protein PVF43_16850 [Candidatus Eiseniibacteriota bacterium]
MQRSAVLLPLALAATLALALPTFAERTGDQELLLVTTASNRGEVDPCG